jgi:glutamyl-tRNA reductase
MAILAVGVSYRRAPVELLERLSFAEEDLAKAYRHVTGMESVREAVILSTCNRAEVVAEVGSYHAGFLDLKRFLAESREIDPDDFADPLYSHYEDHAIQHVFGVAAGLDSMVVGEPQILSQVRGAARRAHEEGATGPVLSALFRGAVRTGRRVRTETEIGASPAAFVEAGADLAARHLGGLAGRSVVVVGAGGMASLAVGHLRELGVGHLRVVNRSVDRARRLASRAGGDAAGLELLAHAIARADLVVSSTGASGTVVDVPTVAGAIEEDLAASRATPRPRFVLDLAVPRDVDPGVAALPGVAVADIDALRAAVSRRGEDVAPQLERAERIVAEESERFAAWRRAWRMAPLIRALRERGDRVVASELARMAPRLAALSDRDREAVRAAAEGVVAKLLHDPLVMLRSANGPGDPIARTIADVFALDVRPEP